MHPCSHETFLIRAEVARSAAPRSSQARLSLGTEMKLQLAALLRMCGHAVYLSQQEQDVAEWGNGDEFRGY